VAPASAAGLRPFHFVLRITFSSLDPFLFRVAGAFMITAPPRPA